MHNVHGIGIFEGIESLEINKVKKDYIKIAYSGGDALYVPVTQLDLVSKYIGPREDTRVKINRLGSGDWQRAKKKVRASVQDMAKELTAIALVSCAAGAALGAPLAWGVPTVTD